MARAPWTYEVPPPGADAAGLEGYVVEASSGHEVGRVLALLEREGELYVAVSGAAPFPGGTPRALPWDDVDRVDHEALTVRLRLGEDGVADALELDPDKRVEDGPADAARVTQLPGGLTPSHRVEAPGPADRPQYLVSVGLGLAGVFSLLVIFIFVSSVDFTWEFVFFAVPALLFAAALVSLWRLWRRPYERVGPRE